MATPADQRLLELLEKWLKSLELHLNYASLDDASYSTVQPWPAHQRPSRWIVDLAQQKAVALQAQVRERIERGDGKFSDSLELMTFLANLLGAEHIERFIPLANADTERAAPVLAESAPPVPAGDVTGTREMPTFLPGTHRAQPPVGTAHVARAERRATEAKPVPAAPSQAAPLSAAPSPAAPLQAAPSQAAPERSATPKGAPVERAASSGRDSSGHRNVAGPDRSPARPPTNEQISSERGILPEAIREQVIADAARLVQWGRKWYELAELIAGMADRPSVTDVRRILKDNKTVIDKKAGRS